MGHLVCLDRSRVSSPPFATFVSVQAALTGLSPSAVPVWGVEVETSTREM